MYSYWPDGHSAFRLPEQGSQIWRYQTLPKLLDLLDTRRLFLCRASKFEDRFEGAIPNLIDAYLTGARRRMEPEAYANFRNGRVEARKLMTVSCWHLSEHESAAMWTIYGLNGEGVAIKSSVARLTAALPQRPPSSAQADTLPILIGKVEYIDYADWVFDPLNPYEPFIHKRQAYQHERELRAVAMITLSEEQTSTTAKPDFEISEGGLAIAVDVEQLIEAVYISPLGSASFERIVRVTLERFGYGSIPVIKSPLAAEPVY
jgi:hypothetical protein